MKDIFLVFILLVSIGTLCYLWSDKKDTKNIDTPVKQIFLLDCNHIPKGNFVGQIIKSEEQFLEYKIKDTKFTYSGNYLLLTK